MDKAALEDLRTRITCPVSGRPFEWSPDGTGRSDAGSTANWADGAWTVRTPGCPAIPETPEYTSSNPYHADCLELIESCADGLVLNWGAGAPRFSFPNVLETEIRRYPSTDMVSTAPRLPFADATFDGVISLSVLEHVRDPLEHTAEIRRVLKPGGHLVLHAAFLQPFHGAPHHYFNMTRSAYDRVLEGFTVDSLRVGAHQHPWLMLRWVLDRYLAGLESQQDKDALRAMTIGEALDRLSALEGDRAATKLLDTPQAIAQALAAFNSAHTDRLAPFLSLGTESTDELAAGFSAAARKPLDSQ